MYEENELCEDGYSSINVVWDYTNEKLEDKMSKEHRNHLEHKKKKSLLWLEKVKELAQWKQGEWLYLFTKQKSDGLFYCSWSKEKNHFKDIIIEPSGYACMRTFNNYTWDEDKDNNIFSASYIRVDSKYNDKIASSLSK